MKTLLVAAALALVGCGPEDETDQPATAQTEQALPSVRGEVPPMQEPQLKPANELFPNSQRPNPFTPTFQQQFMYTAVHVPH